MKIGIVGDTHNNLRNVAQIVRLFNGFGVERVIHTGDISQPKTLDILAALSMPVFGVWGNNDLGEQEELARRAEQLGFAFSEPPLELIWHERSILVVHDPLEMHGVLVEHHELVLHGHTHLYRHERQGHRLIFNPGECAGHLSGFNAVGIVDLENLSASLLKF